MRQKHLDEKTRDAISSATGTGCTGNKVIKTEKDRGGKRKLEKEETKKSSKIVINAINMR